MKLKQIFYWMGFKPKPMEYGYKITEYDIKNVGKIQYAHWLHPKMRKYYITDDQVASCKSILSEGDIAIDIGAHAGDSTLPIALATGKTGTVFAFEPNKYVFSVLVANSELNRDRTHIIPLNYAAAQEDGELVFKYSDPGFCNGGKLDFVPDRKHAHFFSLAVRGVNIPSVLAREYPEEAKKIKYIKIDSEGSDHLIVMSLRPIIDACRPILKTEVYTHVSQQNREAYLDYLVGMGYEVRKNGPDELPEDRVFEKSRLMDEAKYDLWALPR